LKTKYILILSFVIAVKHLSFAQKGEFGLHIGAPLTLDINKPEDYKQVPQINHSLGVYFLKKERHNFFGGKVDLLYNKRVNYYYKDINELTINATVYNSHLLDLAIYAYNTPTKNFYIEYGFSINLFREIGSISHFITQSYKQGLDKWQYSEGLTSGGYSYSNYICPAIVLSATYNWKRITIGSKIKADVIPGFTLNSDSISGDVHLEPQNIQASLFAQIKLQTILSVIGKNKSTERT